MSDWPWPNVYRQKLEVVHKQIESGNQLGALGLLDYYRPTLVKEDGDFFFIERGFFCT